MPGPDRRAVAHDLRATLFETTLRQQPAALAANAISAAIVVGVLWGAFSHVWLLLWLGLAYAVTLGRYLAIRTQVRRSSRTARSVEWTRKLTLGAASSGVMWG